ncbi:extracellular solute-binding protein [Blautia sp. HCP3S3_H10_1]|uniref:extracellular solute-binding protein n=1 Tax=unclassified Blautia TaxID=2648079 RepID=UPI003F8FCA47|nr:extracellular solute-binding protein [Clostridia bacterium]
MERIERVVEKVNNRWRIFVLGMAFSMAASLAGCKDAGKNETEGIRSETQNSAQDSVRDGEQNNIPAADESDDDNIEWEEKKAATTPYGKYPELVTYTLGQISGANNSNLPEGNTYEDNAYTRYLKEILNIQNKNTYMEREDRYNAYVNVLVNDHTLPDVLVVSDRETLNTLVENDLVEDLTKVYANCTSPRIKAMYNSYGPQLLGAGTFDGKLMALPEAVIDHGPCLLWMRKDWMEQLGLEEPDTLEEAMDIIQCFQENRMGAEEGEEPVGLVCDTNFVSNTSQNYSVEPVFEKFYAYPRRWIKDENGEIVYGSLTEETRSAVAYLRELYERGILDQNFALRAQNNLRDLVVEGKCGAFFGLWWAPNNPLMDEIENDPEADWEPYYLTADYQEKDNVYASFMDNKYVVVRKGYEHPEIVMKIISVLFDYSRFEDVENTDEINSYFALNVDPTARPLVINVDYNEAIYNVTKDIRRVMVGTQNVSNLSALEKSYYDACMKYVNGENVTAEDWAAYKSRISAVGVLVDGHYKAVRRQYLMALDGEVPNMLATLEKNAFIQMIMGEQPLDYFDTFVKEWYEQGGQELTEKIREENS